MRVDCTGLSTAHRRTPFQRILLAASLLFALFLVACSRTPSAPASQATAGTRSAASATATDGITPTAPTTPSAPAPTRVITPTQTAASDPAAQTGDTFTSPRYGYTVTLPCCWVALPAPATAVEAALSDLAAGTGDPLYDNLLEALRENQSGVSLEYLAYLPDANGLPEAQLTVSVLPAQQLTLASYIDGVTADLGGIGATAVVTGQIDYTLRPGDTPASVIEYTTVYDADPLHGLQVAFFTATGNHLIVLTFTTSTGKYAGLEDEFMHIARSVSLDG